MIACWYKPYIRQKGEKTKKAFRLSASTGLKSRTFQPTKTISPFFDFFVVLSYVGYVPASDDLCICCFIWRSEFSSKFLFVTEEKSTFCSTSLRPVLTAHLFFCFFANLSYVCFVSSGNHLGIVCFFHDGKKSRKKVSPPISPFCFTKG